MKKINEITIKIATKSDIISWCETNIKSSETINYKTAKKKKGGLFCDKIFKNTIIKHECKKEKCLKCINKKIQQNQLKMSYIKLNHIIIHQWFIKSRIFKVKKILKIENKLFKEIAKCNKYIVTESRDINIKVNTIIKISQLKKKSFNKDKKLTLETGGNAIEYIIKNRKKEIKKKNNKKLLKAINDFELMLLKIIPVLSPQLRPIINISDNRYITSNLNEAYRIIITSNNRLKRLIEVQAPEIVKQEEKKKLQYAINDLFGPNDKKEKELKSIANRLKGKKGLFRYNLLGKRVNFSARAVITVNPNIKINKCGIPEKIAIEIYKPFIYKSLINTGISTSIKQAENEINNKTAPMKYILNKIIKNKPVLLNRAPTLHRMNFQGFMPYITKKNSIEINPLVCKPFNADFDGDQMAIHIPLLKKTQKEIKKKIINTKNIFATANKNINFLPSNEAIMGIYQLTKREITKKKRPIIEQNIKNIIMIKDNIKDIFQTIYIINKEKKIINTTLGRIIFFNTIKDEKIYLKYNKAITKKDIEKICKKIYRKYGKKTLINFIQKITNLGFKYATEIGNSISIKDLIEYKKTKKIIKNYNKKTEFNRKSKSKKISNKIKDENLKLKLVESIKEKIKSINKKRIFKKKNRLMENKNIFEVINNSKAKNIEEQITQLSGIRGIILNNNNTPFSIPILTNLKKGMNMYEYLISTFGARKGLSDTAIKTAISGYFTRRLVESARETIIINKKCKNCNDIMVKKINKDLIGRYVNRNVYSKNRILIKKNELINKKKYKKIVRENVKYVFIRSPSLCDNKFGICQMCYGIEINKKKVPSIGTAVGTIAAQSIGEPGTQLTMRTFHTGGTLNTKRYKEKSIEGIYITKITPDSNIIIKNNKIKSLSNKGSIILRDINGRLKENIKLKRNIIINFKKENKNLLSKIKINIKYTNKIHFAINEKLTIIKNDGNKIFANKKNSIYSTNKKFIIYIKLKKRILKIKIKKNINLKSIGKVIANKEIIELQKKNTFRKDITDKIKEISGILEMNSKYKNNIINIIKKNKKLNCKNKNKYNKRKKNKKDLINKIGLTNTINMIIKKILKLYKSHAVNINKKHMETIIKPLIKKITYKENIKNKKLILHKYIIIGITKSIMSSKSFLSIASFRSPIKILIAAALNNNTDKIKGIKENIITGNMPTIGKGINFYKKNDNKSTNKNRKEKKK